MKKYRKEGFVVLRTAGSHGFADLIAIHPQRKRILFIQSKPSNYPDKQVHRLYKGNQWVDDEFICKYIVE